MGGVERGERNLTLKSVERIALGTYRLPFSGNDDVEPGP